MAISNISLTSSMRSNLISLQNTQKLMDTTQNRLSTGKKVNSAMDNPSNYFTAQSLTARANDLSALMDSIGQAISTLETADEGITSLTKFVDQAKSIANSARDTMNVKSSKTSSVMFDPTNVKNQKVLDAVGGIAAGDSFTIRLGNATEMTGNVNLNPTQKLSDLGVAAGQNLEIIVDGEKYTFTTATAGTAASYNAATKTSTVGIDMTVEDFMADIVENIGRKNVSAELVDGRMEIKTLDNTSLVIRSEATKADGLTINAANITGAADSDQIIVGGVTVTLTDAAGNKTAQAVADAINADAAATVKASVDTDGNLFIQAKDGSDLAAGAVTGTNAPTPTVTEYDVPGSSFNDKLGFDNGSTVTITADMTAEDLRKALVAIDGVFADFNDKGNLIVYGEQGDDFIITDKTGKAAQLLGINGSATNGNNARATYATQFDSVLTQIDQLVNDTSYKGINLLKGDDLTVNFNETRTSFLEIKGVTFDSKGIGLTVADNEWKTNEDIDKSLTQIEKATSLLRAQASEFGQNLATVTTREDFTSNMINNLVSGSDKLTLADMNEEAANMLALQTRQQLATNSLSMASQAAQSVLSLF